MSGPGSGDGEPPTALQQVPDTDAFAFEDVQMTAGSLAPGTAPFQARVEFDPGGIGIDGGSSARRYAVPWSEVRGVWFGLPMSPPTGGLFTPIDVVWVGGSARMLLPGDRMRSVRMTALEARLSSWSPSPPTGPPLLPAFSGFGPAGVVGMARAPSPYIPPPPVAPYGPDAVPPAWYPVEHAPLIPRSGRRRRWAVLVGGVVLIVAAVSLAFGLAARHPTTVATRPPPLSADQQLADRILLTRRDLPVGWRVDHSVRSSGNAPQLRAGEAAITHTFATCMGITDAQAQVVFGGASPDQTAEATSPIFEAPASSGAPGFALEVQTGAAVVRTSGDEQRDIAPFSDRRYAACAATATASELQLGVDQSSGTHGSAGPATGVVVALPTPAGQQLSALSVTFTVSDRSVEIPVHVESVMLASGRIEAELQAFAIGGSIPEDVLYSSLAAFEQRVAFRGTGVQL